MASLIRTAATALAFAGMVSAQSSSVISVFLPDTDQQTLVGSLVASDATKTTVAFGCPAGEDSSDCGFGLGQVTATFGSSTLIYTQTLDLLTLGLDCAVTGTTAAVCAQTYIGPAGYLESDTATDDSLTATDASFNTQLTTSVSTTALSASDIAFIPITLTAFPSNGASSTSAGTGASEGASATTSTSSASATSSGGNATSTTQNDDAVKMGGQQLRWIASGAGVLALVAILL
ncbi:hypothetical protein G647_07209 [Cladophialophora carrionii CBS 160.54]|uniref:Uncharacterized protein n=1 Tax=Cladophialophora carrionii CBS 160.54 TaxID=1279043 RepID=V9D2N2_9EURO|nr:uncharacterized protein G647_07209 [Cladophialophora carrionii CBS 160.54]ETI20866.1 hypothetical protein G647_07209 [Cladophialophora carrionii CBS 160.54]